MFAVNYSSKSRMLFTDICCLQLNQSFSRPCKAPDNSSSRLESPSSVDFLNVSNDSYESETSKNGLKSTSFGFMHDVLLTQC